MISYRQVNNLFLRQSYIDSWQEYRRWLEVGEGWDYIILTASNEAQAEGYRREISYRVEQGYLPESCQYVVLPDPEGKRVGSGGATFNVLRYLSCECGDKTADVFGGRRILVIHSGGDSKRVPQYSVCGKLFSPVPRQLPDGRPSTLFDEFMIAMSAVAGRIEEGMLVLSGDVLLLFNPLQLDFQYRGAAAISIKTNVAIGKEHGVYLNNGENYVGRFLHKQSEEALRRFGAVNANGNVDLDTGAVLLDKNLLTSLFTLIGRQEQGHVVYDKERFDRMVNDRVRISFYGDFLYPLATESTLDDYYMQAPEGAMSPELLACRTEIWEALSSYSMKLICLSPAQFIHFGTTGELRRLVTEEIGDYRFLDWSSVVNTNVEDGVDYAAYNSVIGEDVVLEKGSYVENCWLGTAMHIGEGCVLSGLNLGTAEFHGMKLAENMDNGSGIEESDQTGARLQKTSSTVCGIEEKAVLPEVEDKALPGSCLEVPAHTALHGLRLPDGHFVVRIYGVQDNPKQVLEKGAEWLGENVSAVLAHYGISPEELWENEEHYLWFARLYPVAESFREAMEKALLVARIFRKRASYAEVEAWRTSRRMSLYGSFNAARAEESLAWNSYLGSVVAVEKYLDILKARGNYREALDVFAHRGPSEEQVRILLQMAESADFSLKIRIYYSLYRFLKEGKVLYAGVTAKSLEEKCFDTIQDTVCEAGKESIRGNREYRIQKQECCVSLPVRVNWGGGWTDTPPCCNENGGIVLNAAIKVNGILPVQVCVRRLPEYIVEFASSDIGVEGSFTHKEEILDCRNPYDHFALHKAALIACGIVTEEGDETLSETLQRLGGGIYLSTRVEGIPKGSGLGTSSILAGACVKAIYEFLGEELTDSSLYDIVLCMEQIMSTGGGWQDQVGGLCPGIKMITTHPGLRQHIQVEKVKISDKNREELAERFALIYTGQRRLARNLLREVVGNYIGGRKESVEALAEMRRVAVLMKYELEEGNIDRFAELLNRHWELSLQLDGGASNTCIDQIFQACEELIDGRFISGAGGGGFLQVILKKDVSAKQLNDRLYEVFQDSGVAVWPCEFV